MYTDNERHGMVTSLKEAADSSSKQEANTSERKKASSSSPSTWLRLKDPRIVRVSRAFGGKDRHSKVCTIRGLKDRRVRLSVPTAIQLYDLQDRLGLNQPSKVIDWLLNVAKDEIDELPPLPALPTGNFRNIQGGSSINCEHHEEKQLDDHHVINEGEASSINFLTRSPSSTNSSLLLPSFPFTGYHLEPSNFTFSQLGNQTTEDLHNFNVVPLPSGSQILVCPPSGATQPFFPSNVGHFQMLSTSSQNLFANSPHQSMRPFHYASQSDKDQQEFPSK